MIPIPGKTTLITGAVGAAAVLVMLFMLAGERSDHAKTKQQLADQRALVAAIREQNAETAVARAEAVAETLKQWEAQVAALLESETRLRDQVAIAEREQDAIKQDADVRIARLLRENEELQVWAATLVPSEWIDFMREPVDAAARGPAAGDP